jgi:glucokinase
VTQRKGAPVGDPGSPPDAAVVTYGIDVGGTKVLGIALDPQGAVIGEARVPTPTGNQALAADEVAGVVEEIVVRFDREVDQRASAVGVGAPGMVDRRGYLHFAPNLPQAHGLDWSRVVGERLPGRRVVVENDANLAVLAEHRLGAARGYRHVVMVTIGTGIGGGIVVDDRVQVGGSGFAGEIGHMVLDPTGPACPCGRRGCWECFASGAGLGVLAREAASAGRLGEVVRLAGGNPENVRGEDVSAAAAAGDPEACQVIQEVGRWIGFGLANLAAVLDPECFVLGGGVVRAGDVLIDAARSAFDSLAPRAAGRAPAPVVPASFGERSGAVGAALAARLGGLW